MARRLLVMLISGAFISFVVPASTALAEDDGDPPFECDARFDDCGSPERSGGGNGGGGSAILIDDTDEGDSYQHADDYSGDGISDHHDNCPFHYNPDQTDTSGDGVGDVCDNCPGVYNPDQTDTNGNGTGDACDPDISGDGILNEDDNCPEVYNPDQTDTSGNGVGDACDPDINGNGIPNEEDPCPFVVWDPDTEEAPDSEECFRDTSGDGIPDHEDNCPHHYNPDQQDTAGDGIGDACAVDTSGDGIPDYRDNCPGVYNPDQRDSDRDGVGDKCDDHFCFVVFGDQQNCLDPETSLDAYTPPLSGDTGERVRLRLFANHQRIPLRYSWSLVSAPDGSDARIEFPEGTVSYSEAFEYRYVGERVPNLLTDLPGDYEVELRVETVWEDPVTGQMNEVDTHRSTITVEGDPADLPEQSSAAACTATTTDSTNPVVWIVAALLGLLAVRRINPSDAGDVTA